MKTALRTQHHNETGTALLLTLVIVGIALTILAGAMRWSANTTSLTHRSIQYTRSVAAAEADTEKVLSHVTRDYLHGGELQVSNNLASYRQMVPTASDSTYWAQWQFSDGNGNLGQTYVQNTSATNYTLLNSVYAGLSGFVTEYTIASHARYLSTPQDVLAGVLQEVQLARIPVFQFAMYSSGDMEISCGQPFYITGKVHANKELYVEPDSTLTFLSDVTAVGKIHFSRAPLDPRGDPVGSVVYQQRSDSDVAAMSLPIGTNNTPEAIREIIDPPPPGEDPNSPMGRQRYYNLAEMVLTVSDSGISASSGEFNNFATGISSNQLASFVTTTNNFWDMRENKSVHPVDIDVGALAKWSQTNVALRAALGGKDVSSIYVVDNRTWTSTNNLAAVRVYNGASLPSDGLTVATAHPLYVWGNYNQTNSANLGTTNTTTTRPASLVADAITILSTRWRDSNSHKSLSYRGAGSTTVNAAILTGAVETTHGHYSGGMENFPRFLESWGSANVFTYNGSMVKMFASKYATDPWGMANVYNPPARNWAYDVNFNDATKLPPLTPSLLKVIRGQWATVAPNQNTLTASP